jgi:hypothetical protein
VFTTEVTLIALVPTPLLLILANTFISRHLSIVIIFLVVVHGSIVIVVSIDHNFVWHWDLLSLPAIAGLTIRRSAVLLLQNCSCTVLSF